MAFDAIHRVDTGGTRGAEARTDPLRARALRPHGRSSDGYRANPRARVFGTAEHCRDIKEEVPDVEFRCHSVFAKGADLGTVNHLPNLLPGVGFTAVKQPHSAASSDPVADPPFPYPFAGCRTVPGLAFDQYPVQPDEPLAWGFQIVTPRSGIIAIAWQRRIDDFAMLWQDTAGPITGACQVRGEIGCDKVPRRLRACRRPMCVSRQLSFPAAA